MVKIAFFNQKGGPGKTTSVVNIAGVMSKNLKKKVLVIDCDSQMTASKYLLTFREDENYASITSYFNEGVPAKDLPQRVFLPKSTNIYVIPSCPNIETISLPDEQAISEMIAPLENEFDYCLFDLPPHLSGISLSALVASEFIIVPALADTDSLSGYNYLIDTVKEIRDNGWNLNLLILGVLFNNVNYIRATQKYILDSSSKNMGDAVFKTYIKSASIIEQARFYGLPLIYYSSSSPISGLYVDLTNEIIKKIKKSRR